MNSRKRELDDDEILEEGDELDYIPAPDSPSADKTEKDDDEDEDDPLDNFMASIEVQARKDKETSKKHEKEASSGEITKKPPLPLKYKLGRTDIEGDDDQESYFEWVEENADKLGAQVDIDQDEEIEYDEYGNPLPAKKKMIDPLPSIDHSKINYEEFNKNFYTEHSQIKELNGDQVADLRKKLDVKVTGLKPAKPVTSFAHFGFDELLMSVIRKSEFSQPTPIQAQAIPIACEGRDVIGIAKTGSGKTAAYLWPALVHIIDQRQLESGEGPICLIVVPTRELAIQVYNEAKRFGKVYNIRTVCAYGGGSKWEQSKDLQEGAEIVVCTPGRLIDLVKIKATNLERVTYLIFDEADRMFELGFEPQVRSIANRVRPDRQCLLFSATFRKRIERLARDILSDPIRIVQGELGEANEDIQQIVEVLPAGPHRFSWLSTRLVSLCATGKVLIFVSQKLHVEELANNLKLKDFHAGALHGDMLQNERNEIITAFRKNRDMTVLVATDVAARGLDIPEIKTVINYDAPKDMDTYIHRIGRTGRAGEKGTAYTLLVSDKDKDFAGYLVRNLESFGHEVTPKLLELANQSTLFGKSRFKQNKAAKPGIGGRGLGFKTGTIGSATSSNKDFTTTTTPTMVTGFNATTIGIRTAIDKEVKTTGTDRSSALKTAFSSSFKSAFHSSSGDSSLEPVQPGITDPTPEWMRNYPAGSKKETFSSNKSKNEFKTPCSSVGATNNDEKSDKNSSSNRKKTRWE